MSVADGFSSDALSISKREYTMNEAVSDIVTTLADAGIATRFAGSILENLPVTSLIFSIAKAARDVPSLLLAAKIKRFIDILEVTFMDERHEFINNIKADPREAKKVGELLLFQLDKADSVDKAELIAIVFIHYLQKKITSDQLGHLCFSVNQLFLSDITNFIQHGLTPTYDRNRLSNTCFVRVVYSVFDNFLCSDVFPKFDVSELGRTFLEMFEGNTKYNPPSEVLKDIKDL